MIYSVISPMGRGKTLFATLYALEYSKIYPNSKIYANFRLNLPNVIFTQFGFLPFSELENSDRALIIFDDFLAIKQQISGLLQIIANTSRKLNLDIILTCQYYTMIPKSVRTLSQIVEVIYKKRSDTLFVAFREEITDEKEISWTLFHVPNAVKIAKELYNTKEIVSFASDENLAAEIVKMSKNKEDIEKNIQILSQSSAKRKYFRDLISKLNSDNI